MYSLEKVQYQTERIKDASCHKKSQIIWIFWSLSLPSEEGSAHVDTLIRIEQRNKGLTN